MQRRGLKCKKLLLCTLTSSTTSRCISSLEKHSNSCKFHHVNSKFAKVQAQLALKRLVHQNMKIVLLITHPHVVSNP